MILLCGPPFFFCFFIVKDKRSQRVEKMPVKTESYADKMLVSLMPIVLP